MGNTAHCAECGVAETWKAQSANRMRHHSTLQGTWKARRRRSQCEVWESSTIPAVQTNRLHNNYRLPWSAWYIIPDKLTKLRQGTMYVKATLDWTAGLANPRSSPPRWHPRKRSHLLFQHNLWFLSWSSKSQPAGHPFFSLAPCDGCRVGASVGPKGISSKKMKRRVLFRLSIFFATGFSNS